jgi:beta-N-acetylhexosaminidase
MVYVLSVATLKEKIGQLFMVGISGEALTPEERSILKSFPVGGFILFGRNCRQSIELLSLCRSLWQINEIEPPFIAIDQEGGRIHRLPEPFTHFPAARQIGRGGDPRSAYFAGLAAGRELALAGINLNFAPVLDVDSNPANPVIGDRAFSSDPAEVVAIASRWTDGLRDAGIIPCGKHFPGHGGTDQDSHFKLPVVEKALHQLTTVELAPFREASRSSIESLMTAHVIYRALDPKFPATLSQAIVKGLLRQQWAYSGVVFGDDMEMKAISDNYGMAEAVSLAVGAGIDVLLYCHDLSRAIDAFEFLCAEAEREPAVGAQVEDRYRRIAKLKRRYLKTFTGVTLDELVKRLVQLDHQRIIDQIQGNL